MSEVSELMPTFELLAALGLSLAGFTGIATAFEGRARTYDAVDLNRLMVLFASSGTVMVASLAVIALLVSGIEGPLTIQIVATSVAVTSGLVALPLFQTAFRNTKDRPEAAPPFAVLIGLVFFVANEALLVASALQGGKAGLLVAALCLTLAYGLFVFVRLLTGATEKSS